MSRPEVSRMTPARIQAIRAGLQLTQRELAERLYTDIRTVQRWLGGEVSPRGPAVRALEELERQSAAATRAAETRGAK